MKYLTLDRGIYDWSAEYCDLETEVLYVTFVETLRDMERCVDKRLSILGHNFDE